MKPYAESCEQNRGPILAILQRVFADSKQILEIANGTGNTDHPRCGRRLRAVAGANAGGKYLKKLEVIADVYIKAFARIIGFCART